ncbi:MAG: tetratricopeptide repeat protein [Bacteroidota bacterium]|nr:tetratricopeptide repeat protein [Bacteroidota bacterium]
MRNRVLLFLTKKPVYIFMMYNLLLAFSSYSQQEKKHVVTGNQHYESKKFEAAEKEYKAGLNKNKNSYKSAFNLGDAYYKQEKYDEAAEQFQILTHRATSKDTLSKVYHNLGNALLKSKKYEASVNAYKNALKNNPSDEDSRYNLAYAQQMLKQQQQKKEDKKDNKKEKDKKEDKKEDKKDEKEKEKNENKEKKPNQNNISKEDAQRLLDALQNDEKNIHDKLKKGTPGVKVEIEKDW